jgi:hypothetical protein
MRSIELFLAGACFLALAWYVLKIWLAVKAPHVYQAMEEVDAKRRERQKNFAEGAVKHGIGFAKLFMK